MNGKKKFFKSLWVLMVVLLFVPVLAFADDPSSLANHWTLWQLLKAGGWTMIVLGLLSVLALTLIFYNFLTIKPKTLVPVDLCDNLIMKLESRDLKGARVLCEKNKNIVTAMALAGINRASRGRTVIREVVEKTLNKETSSLFKSIAFLGDIASIAPLLGLLGTVIGMIQAFNVISTAGNDLRPIMLVGGISKALITTASGLVIAIPALGFYFYFRATMQEIVDSAHDYSTDIIKLLEESCAPANHSSSRMRTAPEESLIDSDTDGDDEEALFHA